MPEACDTSAFYVHPERIDGERVEFDRKESGHISRVLRLQTGDTVSVLDGAGGVYAVELAEVGNTVRGRVTGRSTFPEPSPRIGAALAIGRSQRLKTAVEKLAELGCSAIWPLRCEHLQFPGKLDKQAGKLQAVAVAAMKQCRRPHLTRIERPQTVDGLIDLLAGRGNTLPVFCHRMGGERAEKEQFPAADEYVLVVGPEGGFSAAEAESIEAGGWPALDLGEWWLRSETAAIVGFTVLADRLRNDFGLHGDG